MTYFLYQTVFISVVAVVSGIIIGWWLHHYYGKQRKQAAHDDFSIVKNYLAESIKESSRLKLQLEQSEAKIDLLTTEQTIKIKGVDFEAYQAFENTVKEAQLRKFLN